MNYSAEPQKTVESAVSALGCTARRGALLERGFSDWDIRRALESGSIRRTARGVYATTGSTALGQHIAGHQAKLSCFSRAKEMGLWVLNEPATPHVATAHGRPVPGCVAHRYAGKLSFQDVLRHCAQCGTELETLCVLESAVVLKRCTIAQLRQAFSRRKDGKVRKIIGMIDPQSMSIAETCSRYHLVMAGHSVQGQAFVRGMGHLDALVDGQLGIEIDGAEYHNDAKAWEEDLRRGNVLTVRGIPTLHFRAAVALYHPEEMLAWVDEALAAIAAAHR